MHRWGSGLISWSPRFSGRSKCQEIAATLTQGTKYAEFLFWNSYTAFSTVDQPCSWRLCPRSVLGRTITLLSAAWPSTPPTPHPSFPRPSLSQSRPSPTTPAHILPPTRPSNHPTSQPGTKERHTIPHRQLAPIRHRHRQILAQRRIDRSQQRLFLEYRLCKVGDARAGIALAGGRDERRVAGGEEMQAGEGDCG
jgi:hypothetical protein